MTHSSMWRSLLLLTSTVRALNSPFLYARASSSLNLVKNRGLEERRDGATPQEGGMTLYLKAAADGTLVGDCPFAHAVRMVLNEKGLEYELRPSTQETKPRWLIEHYEGKMPALRHRKECYVESEVICQYLEFFFPQPSLTPDKTAAAKANEAVDGFFPALARYLKHTPDGDEQDEELKQSLEAALQKLEDHLSDLYLCGEKLSLQDCALAPKLYHLKTGIKAFKNNAIDLQQQFPKVSNYMDKVFARQSFTDALYPEDVVVWGWGNARK